MGPFQCRRHFFRSLRLLGHPRFFRHRRRGRPLLRGGDVPLTPKVAFWFDDLIYGMSHRPEPEEGPGIPDGEEDEEPEEQYAGQGLVVEGAQEADTDPTDDWLDFTDSEGTVTASGLPDVHVTTGPETAPEPETDPAPVDQGEVQLTVEKSENEIIDGLSDEEWRDRYDPRLDLPKFKLPPMSILNDYKDKWYEVSRQELENNKQRIVNAHRALAVLQAVMVDRESGLVKGGGDGLDADCQRL